MKIEKQYILVDSSYFVGIVSIVIHQVVVVYVVVSGIICLQRGIG